MKTGTDAYKNYDKHLSNTSMKKGDKKYHIYENYYRKNILKFLPPQKKARVVDLGCGQGEFLYFLKKNGYNNILGIDLIEKNVQICKSRGLKAKKYDLQKYVNNVKNKSDVFILSNVLEHFTKEEIIEILKGLYKRLNNGGSIFIIIPNCNNIYGLATFFSDITHKSALIEKSFDDLLSYTRFKKYYFYNLIVYPNIFLLDYIIKIYSNFVFQFRKLNNLLNGQKPYKVQSKNMMVAIRK